MTNGFALDLMDVVWTCRTALKLNKHGRVSLLINSGPRLKIWNKFFSKYDTVTSLLVYHKYLQIRPGLEYDTWYRHKINLVSAFHLLNHCVDESEFCLITVMIQKLWNEDNMNTHGRSLSTDVTVSCFRFHTLRSLNIPRPAVTFERLLSVHDLCPSVKAPPLLPKLRLTRVRMRKCSQPEGIPSGAEDLLPHSSGAVWESRWTFWAVRPNEPSGFRGRKDLLHRASALVTTCP